MCVICMIRVTQDTDKRLEYLHQTRETLKLLSATCQCFILNRLQKQASQAAPQLIIYFCPTRRKLIVSQKSYSPKIQLMKKATGTLPLWSEPPKQISFHGNRAAVLHCWSQKGKKTKEAAATTVGLWGTRGNHKQHNDNQSASSIESHCISAATQRESADVRFDGSSQTDSGL